MAVLIAASSLRLYGQAAVKPDDVLEQVRAKLRATTNRLPRYTCVQTIERRYYKHGDSKTPPSCDQISGDRRTGRTKLQLYATDRLRMDVAVADGREMVSWVGAGKFDSRRVDEIVGEGPTGTGAFGGHLVDIFNNAGVHFRYLGEKIVGGKSELEYRFTVPLLASNYRIRGGLDWHLAAYDGTFQIDGKSLELDRLELRTDELPLDTGMCEAGTKLEYQQIHIGDSDFLLPRQSELQIVQRDARETTNVTTFSSCREYHTESTIHYEGEETPEAGTQAKAAEGSSKNLPEGLSLSLALTAKIDTATAAAGDVVAARVTHAVRDPKTRATLIPAGAIARGRIARMRHRVGGPDDFIILIAFDALEANGTALPLFVKLDSIEQFERVRTTMAVGRMRSAYVRGPETWGALIFPVMGNKYIVPAGYESTWRTVGPPAVKPGADDATGK